MKGRNTLIICHAQMNQIVQEWIDRQNGALANCNVQQVIENKGDNSFEIGLEQKPEQQR